MSQGVIATLRDRVPIRPLSRQEAMRVKELQATRFLKLVGIDDGPVPETAISRLPKIQVERFSPLPMSGAAEWSHGRWLILLNGAESPTRNRFSLAHELAHILDNRFYSVLYKQIPEDERDYFVERTCDYFAGCLLMPRHWVKRAWGNGLQRLPDLAEHFGVSQAAASVRLQQIGLGDPPARCSRLTPGWSRRWQPGTEPSPSQVAVT